MGGPLTGLRVIEMVGLGPCPFAAMMLADMGAEVIRIHPRRGAKAVPLLDTRFDVMARGRRSLALDLKAPGGAEALLRLSTRADALIEGFRPGVMERLGIGPEPCRAANPRLVYGRMTGWGQDGPMAARAGHDINYIGLSGVLAAIGRKDGPPAVPLNLIGDFGGGMTFAFGLVCALWETARSGEGQVVDAAMTDTSALMAAMIWGFRAAGAWSTERYANLLDGAAPFYDTYECADGKALAVGCIEPQFHDEMLRRLGRDAAEFAARDDPASWPKLKERLDEVFRGRTRDEWAAHFEAADACVTPVLDWDEARAHPHNVSRGTFVEREGVPQPAPGPRFSRTSPRLDRPPPKVGAHSMEILADWGFTPAEIEDLRASGAV